MSTIAVIMCIIGSIGAIVFIIMVGGNTGGGCLSIIQNIVPSGENVVSLVTVCLPGIATSKTLFS
jgi:hypothetical protein